MKKPPTRLPFGDHLRQMLQQPPQRFGGPLLTRVVVGSAATSTPGGRSVWSWRFGIQGAISRSWLSRSGALDVLVLQKVHPFQVGSPGPAHLDPDLGVRVLIWG